MEVLRTGSGFWSALVWAATALGSFLIIWLFSRAFESGYKKGTDQTDPFLSGNPPAPGQRVTASHIYWGFVEALKGYYQPLVRAHSGIVNDYLAWAVLVGAIIFALLGGLMR
jgi:hypothetical protein